MRYKAIPVKDDIPEKVNPIFRKFSAIFNVALNKDIGAANDIEVIKRFFVPFIDNEYEKYDFINPFKNIIKIKFDQIEKIFNDIIKSQSSFGVKGNLYLLVGKIGTGKTTFFYRYFSRNESFNTAIIDLSSLSSDILPTREEIENLIIKRIGKYLRDNFNNYFCDKELMLKVLNVNIEEGVRYEYLDEKINKNNSKEYYQLLTDYIFINNNKKILFIFDNADTCDLRILNTIISIIKELLIDYPSVFILAIRNYIPSEETLGKNFQNIYPMLMLPKNNLIKIIKKRMQLAIDEFNDNDIKDFDNELEIIQVKRKRGGDEEISSMKYKVSIESAKEMLVKCIDHFEKSTGEHAILSNIQKITDNNIRDAIALIYAFLHSSNLDLGPIFANIYDNKENQQEYRIIDFRDFIDCAISMHRRCFDTISSPIKNIFNFDDSFLEGDFLNTLGIYLILKIIFICKNVNRNNLHTDLNDLSMSEERIRKVINKMLLANLITSKHHEYPDIDHVTVYNITSKGEIYLNYLPFRFSYLYYASDDTPMDKEYIVSYNEREESFKYRKHAVLSFINFLKDEENRLNEVLKEKPHLRAKIYYSGQKELFNEISISVNNEISNIERGISYQFTGVDKIL